MEETAMQHFSEDEVILTQDSTARTLYKIISGSAALYLGYGTPEEYLVGVLAAQRCFGELSILCGKPSPYTVVALGDVLVLRVTQQNFDEFIKHNPKNAIDIMTNLAKIVDTLSLNLNQLGEELATVSSAKSDLEKFQDITPRVRQRAAVESIRNALFSERA